METKSSFFMGYFFCTFGNFFVSRFDVGVGVGIGVGVGVGVGVIFSHRIHL